MAQQSDRGQVEHFPIYIGVLIALIVASIVAASFIGVADEMHDQEAQAADYCNQTYSNATTVWVENGQLLELRCKLENGTLVDIPDDVFS